MIGRAAIVGLTGLMLSTGVFTAAAAAEAVPHQRAPGAAVSQQGQAFDGSLRVEQVGDKIVLNWNESPIAADTDGGYYIAQVWYYSGRGGFSGESTRVRSLQLWVPGDRTSATMNTSADDWKDWWQDPKDRPHFMTVRLWAMDPDGRSELTDEWGIPVVPPAPDRVTPNRPTTTRNTESSLTFQGIGRDWQTPVRKGENITIDAVLSASAGSAQKTVELWWYPDANLMKPKRIGDLTMNPVPLDPSHSLDERQSYRGHLDLKATETGHVVGVYNASPGQTVDTWGAITRNIDTTVKSHGTYAKVVGASDPKVAVKGAQKRTVKKGKYVALMANVQNLKGVKRVKVLDGGKVIGEAHRNKKGEWTFKYKAKAGTHRITFKAFGSSKFVKSSAIEIVGK